MVVEQKKEHSTTPEDKRWKGKIGTGKGGLGMDFGKLGLIAAHCTK